MKLLVTIAFTVLWSLSMNAQRVGLLLGAMAGHDEFQKGGEIGLQVFLGPKESTVYHWMVGISGVNAEHNDFWGEDAKATGVSIGRYKRGKKGWYFYGTGYFGDQTDFGGTIGYRWSFFGIHTGYNSLAGLQLGLNLTM